MDRRTFLKTTGAGALLAGSGVTWAQANLKPLPILPLVDLAEGFDGRFELALTKGTFDFGNGAASDTFGINSPYLGQQLRVKQGQDLPFDVVNNLDEVAAIHWHGLHIPGEVDGGPHQEIEPGHSWSPVVPIRQQASFNWFHAHTHGRAAKQVYTGLAGLMQVEDDASLSADLPKTYGVDDFTIVLQDKTFGDDGKMAYVLTKEGFEDGFLGDALVVNGTIAPVGQAVPSGLVRLRILNACNARFLELKMENGPMTVIASDGGFLASAVETDNLIIGSGERYEVLVDMSAFEENSLRVASFAGYGAMFGFLRQFLNNQIPGTAVLTLKRNGDSGFTGSMPNKLANLAPADANQATVIRNFTLEMGEDEELAVLAANWGNLCGVGQGMAINGLPMKMDRIDQRSVLGETELWRIEADEELHPFHVHGCSFRIVEQESHKTAAYAQGWKDIVHVQDGAAEILVRFDYEAPDHAPYMYHCHILEHEDCGMMGQVSVSAGAA